MFFKALRDLARPQVVALIDVLKRSDGLPVGELAERLKMSYMGVKQYCLELEKRGYLDTWRRPKETGRPEMTYRLTPKAQILFPQQSTDLTMAVLDAVRQLHGPTAVEKILFQYFLRKTESYSKKIKGLTLMERATALTRLRDHEGYCAEVGYDTSHGLRMTEHHNPLSDLMRVWPSVARMEEAMMEKLLQAPVKRDVASVSGLVRITFLLAGATVPAPAPPTTTARPRVKKQKISVPTATPLHHPTSPPDPSTHLASVHADHPKADEIPCLVANTHHKLSTIAEIPPFDEPSPVVTHGIPESIRAVDETDTADAEASMHTQPEAAFEHACGTEANNEPALPPAEDSIVPPSLTKSAESAVTCQNSTPPSRPRTEDGLLFDDLAPIAARPPRPAARALSPTRAAKPNSPEPEEWLLSL